MSKYPTEIESRVTAAIRNAPSALIRVIQGDDDKGQYQVYRYKNMNLIILERFESIVAAQEFVKNWDSRIRAQEALDATPISALVEAMRRIQTDTSSTTYPAPDCVARVKIIADEALAAWGTE